MTTKLSLQITTLLLTLLFTFVFSLATVFADSTQAGADDHADSSKDISTEDPTKIAQMKQIVAILTQIIELYKQKAKMTRTTVAEDHHETTATTKDESDELKVWVEIHSNQTHAHVQKPGMKEQSWLLANIKYTEEEVIINTIAEKSGLAVDDIKKIIVFPSGEVDVNGDSAKQNNPNADEDVSGIHIMRDGKVMWGNGTEVQGATITADDKVKLSDGRIITPKFDLR